VALANLKERMNEIPADKLTFEWFSARLKTKFRVQLKANSEYELELVEAAAAPPQTAGRGTNRAARVEAFSLLFTGPGDRLLPQGTYRLEYGHKEQFDLFVVPVGQGPDTFQYQVIFNRFIPEVRNP
jgi:hypothetical protein